MSRVASVVLLFLASWHVAAAQDLKGEEKYVPLFNNPLTLRHPADDHFIVHTNSSRDNQTSSPTLSASPTRKSSPLRRSQLLHTLRVLRLPCLPQADNTILLQEGSIILQATHRLPRMEDTQPPLNLGIAACPALPPQLAQYRRLMDILVAVARSISNKQAVAARPHPPARLRLTLAL